ncbi:hypothetical protein MAA8898_00867 [Maliponia aquimaris]|uniref:Uncharacterized protein n=2 Tax=Maliponia aquimaris TaxID=1673631 RepID=A0A238K0Z1_9RHOB|nr:hypothetical protein MAA8898_00867 [Maliponia aquimaris]
MRPKSLVKDISAGVALALMIQSGQAMADAGGVLDPQTRALQMEQYQEVRRKSILEIQPFRTTQTAQGADGTSYELVSLNPGVNAWFVLTVSSTGYWSTTRQFHLELADPENTTMQLAPGDEPTLVIGGEATEMRCAPWSGRRPELDEAQYRGLPYAPICDERVYLRNEVRGNSTNREAVAEFLRDHVVFGESIVGLIKGTFYEDAFMNSGPVIVGADAGETVQALGKAQLDSAPVFQTYFNFDLEGAEGGRVEAGSWYAVKDVPGVYASAMQPGMIAGDILSRPGETHGLDGVERRADVYLVAFDLEQFELGFEPGTEHPRLEWSQRPAAAGGINYRIPGPDGFDTSAPLVRSGMLSPSKTDRVAATFAAGFKRSHGAFRATEMASTYGGHHYGFVSEGVIFSKLVPDLATIFVLDDGSIHMRTWTVEDDALLPRIRYARQNGVPLIENGVPGAQVRSWLGGNWSGSAEADLRTLRGGTCFKMAGGRPFLIYAYFSTVTPSGMARTFQSYGCDYAMLLDMNSQEHTYMAVYTQENGDVIPHHIVRGMAEIDSRRRDGTPIPRFVGFSDNRDFIYLLRK